MKKILLLILAVFVFSGCTKKQEAEKAAEVPVFAVNTIRASQGQILDYISLSGDVKAGSTVDAYSDAAGKVTQIYVSVGQRVTRGQAVAAVDPSRPGMSFRESIAASPISGTVVSIPAQVGMTVNQAVPLVRIQGSGALEIQLHVAERFISKMALNLPCIITLDAWPGDVFQGSIHEISPTVDLASRTMQIRVNVSDTSSKLKQGMFAKVRIITEQKENIVKIPSSAMLSRFGENYVFVVEQGPEHKIARKRIVVPGILIDGVLEIQSGLAPNEEVVARGQTLIDDGVRVNVIEQLSLPPAAQPLE